MRVRVGVRVRVRVRVKYLENLILDVSLVVDHDSGPQKYGVRPAVFEKLR